MSQRQLLWHTSASVQEELVQPPIILTIATPDYVHNWQFCIESQSRYAHRNGYDHRVVDPTGSILHPKWTKLEIAAGLVEHGHDVLLIDSDAEPTERCPPFMEALAAAPDHDILFVLGISGRPNSGVLILRGSGVGAAFLRECLERRLEPVPTEYFVTAEGENGHVIWLLKKERYASRAYELPFHWNCSRVELRDRAFIRHYTNELRRWFVAMARG